MALRPGSVPRGGRSALGTASCCVPSRLCMAHSTVTVSSSTHSSLMIWRRVWIFEREWLLRGNFLV
jgi:hypothetical protein